MSQQTSTQVRKLVIGIVLLAAILMIVYVPFQSFKMVNPILGYQLERIEQFKVEENPSWPLLTLTTWLVSFFYPFWGTMSVLAGIALLAIAKALYDGKVWARGLSLFCLAIPSMGGAYMIVPWMNFVGSKEGGFPPAVLIMTVGLIPYFAVLLAEIMVSVTNAMEGKWAPTLRKIVNFCFVEEPEGRGYYFNFLKVTGVLILASIMITILVLTTALHKKPAISNENEDS